MCMKHIYTAALAFALAVTCMLTTASCSDSQSNECRIHGTMESSQWDGKRIFLVPMFGPQDAAHVDSVVIKDKKFEFTVDTTEMKIIRVDYHFRDGVQDLLVVSEPGDVNVIIGANSISGGTPQNDSLQVWKDNVMKFNREYNDLRMKARQMKSDDILMTEGKEIQKKHRAYNEQMAERMTPGVFKDFLMKMYPKKSK